MNEVDVAWAAGLFEGEGSVGCYRANSKNWFIVLKIVLDDSEPLMRFADFLDIGNVRIANDSQRNKIHYIYQINKYDDIDCIMTAI